VLVILTTHPIQYQVPVWQSLAERGNIAFEVWYLSDQGVRATLDKEFDQTFRWDLDMLAGYSYRFVPVRPNPADVSRFRGTQLRLPAAILRSSKLSALWINGWHVQAYWQAAFAAHQQGIPVWLRGETNDLHRPTFFKRLPRYMMLRALFRRVRYFLYIGSANRRLYKRFGVPDQKLISTPYCVDNQRFQQAAQALQERRSEIRQEWCIPKQACCFLFSGKFIPKKRPLDLLEAAAQLIRKQVVVDMADRLHILMVGDGELRPKLEAKARELEALAGRPLVTFAGFLNQSQIPQAYAAADYLVLPSDTGETWGLVVNEALASGRPVIVSDLCGCAEDLARPLGSQHVYHCGNTAELANRMLAAITDDNPIRAEQCVHLVGQFAIEKTVVAVEQLYYQPIC
jgi:glycosyltransferase involved in cell wall biosynthesis